VRRIAADPAFGPPVSRAIAETIGAAIRSPFPADPSALAASAEGRLAVFMLIAPVDQLETAALLAAAAAMQREILAATDKGERARLRAALGADAYQVATREAPVLYAGLAALGDAARYRAALAPELDAAATRRQFVDFGLALLLRVVRTVAALPELIVRRLPPVARLASRDDAGDPAKLIRLIDRRMPLWPAITG
jgi:hypothetical protein